MLSILQFAFLLCVYCSDSLFPSYSCHYCFTFPSVSHDWLHTFTFSLRNLPHSPLSLAQSLTRIAFPSSFPLTSIPVHAFPTLYCAINVTLGDIRTSVSLVRVDLPSLTGVKLCDYPFCRGWLSAFILPKLPEHLFRLYSETRLQKGICLATSGYPGVLCFLQHSSP